MRSFDIVFWYPYDEVSPNDGLVVLLADLIKASALDNVAPRLLVSSRHEANLRHALDQNGATQAIAEWRVYDVTPTLFKLLRAFDRGLHSASDREGVHRLIVSGGWGGAVKAFLLRKFDALVDTALNASLLVAVGSVIATILWLPFLIVLTPVFVLFLLFLALARRSLRLGRRLLGHRGRLLVARARFRIGQRGAEMEGERLGQAISKDASVKKVFSPFCFSGQALAYIRQPKLVAFPDAVTFVYPTRFAGLASPDFEKVASKALKASTEVVTYSREIADNQLCRFFAPHIKGKKIHIIPHGFFKPANFDDIGRVQVAFENHFKDYCSYIPAYDLRNIPYVTYPSVDRPHKNTLTLVRAVDYMVRSQHVNIKMISTSHVVNPDVHREIQQKRLFWDCLFSPRLPEESLYYLIKHARILVNPTLSEAGNIFNFSRAVAAGVPALLSDIPIVREMFEQYGVDQSVYGRWLFEPRDHYALAAAITTVLADRKSFVTEQAAVLEKLSVYDYRAMAVRYHEAYYSMT